MRSVDDSYIQNLLNAELELEIERTTRRPCGIARYAYHKPSVIDSETPMINKPHKCTLQHRQRRPYPGYNADRSDADANAEV